VKVFIIHTSTHDPKESTSSAMVHSAVASIFDRHSNTEVRWVDAASLHIVENQSCYAGGDQNCGNPKSGPYRCWAHHNSVEDPDKYGGVDEMPVIYDGLGWCDVVLFTSSVRWGSHTAVMQRVIERMNTLTGRATTWGEAEPLAGKRVGVIVAGFNWRVQQVGLRLAEVLDEMGVGFLVPVGGVLTWQASADPYEEQVGEVKPDVEAWLSSTYGQAQVDRFVQATLYG
jgi:multimeric flavodoxin WrbA